MKNVLVVKDSSNVVTTTTSTISTSTSAVKRLYEYFEDNPDEIIDIDVLKEVAGIRDWTRAIRFVRKKYKFKIEYVKASYPHNAGYIYKKRLAN